MWTEKVCCCIPIKIAVITIGWIQMVGILLQITAIYVITCISYLPEDLTETVYRDLSRIPSEHHLNFMIAIAANLVLLSFASICLLYGAYLKRADFLIPYLVIIGLYIVLYAAIYIAMLIDAMMTAEWTAYNANSRQKEFSMPKLNIGPLIGTPELIVAPILIYSEYVVGVFYRYLRSRKQYYVQEALIVR